eukprot:Amastigsp_a2444_767.p3 type:complete len:107 gc:universal Amastigsp_a2444_767:588-268(-)
MADAQPRLADGSGADRTRERSRSRTRKPKKSVVDFSKWDIAALKRYKKHYKLRVQHDATKSDLVAAITEHFDSLPCDEFEIMSFFVFAVRNREKYELLADDPAASK